MTNLKFAAIHCHSAETKSKISFATRKWQTRSNTRNTIAVVAAPSGCLWTAKIPENTHKRIGFAHEKPIPRAE
jgi:hypothetical protein